MISKSIVFSVGAAVLFLLVVGSGLLLNREQCHDFNQATLDIKGRHFPVAVAKTDIEKERGLAGCTRVPAGHGMYFPFDPPSTVTFWMKGMRIPIDIIWIAQGKVVGIERNVPAAPDKLDTELLRYKPPQPVSGVLEVGAGQAATQGIMIGTAVQVVP